MKRPLLLAALLLLGACAQVPTVPPQSGAPSVAASTPPPLLLISIDAFRANYVDRGMTPTLKAMAATGVRATAMEPAFPSLTFPNHYTLVTGLYPDHHGIVNNTMVDPKLGKFALYIRKAVQDPRWWNEAEPIWVTADKHGLKTATMFWPGSGAKIHGYYPDHWRAYDGHVTADQRVDQVLKWLDLPKAQRPTFLTLYFDHVDHAGHSYGPDTPQVDAALRHVDDAIGRLVAGLKSRGLYQHMNIIVVSDHGMASTPANQRIVIDKFINLKHVRVVSLGVLAGFIPEPAYAKAVATKLLKPHPHMTCVRKHDFPARFHYGSNARIPPLDCLADVGWIITSAHRQALMKKYQRKPMLGDHGYDNADPAMRALFIAHGPAFRQGVVVPEFPNVDVYPLMAHLLRIPALTNDGSYSAVEDMLKPQVR